MRGSSWPQAELRPLTGMLLAFAALLQSGVTPVKAEVDGLQYIASYPDLIRAFGANPAAGVAHYTQWGRAEGRRPDRFNENGYLGNYPDLRIALGTNIKAATVHYIQHGYFEGRQHLPMSPLPPDPVAREVAVAGGLNFFGQYLGRTQGETPAFDYDGDGDPDIVLSMHGATDWPLMRNNGDGSFTTVATFPKTDRHGCAAADLGSPIGTGRPDGLPDLYCVVGACRGVCRNEYPNGLYLQRPDRTFVDFAEAWGVADPHGRGRVPLLFDYDRDGLDDILVVNEAPSIFPTQNRLYRNLGGGFAEVSGSPLTTETYSKCGKAADLDGDAWIDVLLCSDQTGAVRAYTFRNVGGQFVDITAETAYRRLRTREFEIVDLNSDGLNDLVVVEETRLSVWLNVDGRHPTMHYSLPLQLGRDVTSGDVNIDGRPDLYVVQGNNAAFGDMLLINHGDGVTFHPIPLPQVPHGDGDVATAIPDWNGSGRTAFLVSNGKWQAFGPYQLLVFSAP